MSSSISAAIFADFGCLDEKYAPVTDCLRAACQEARVVPLVVSSSSVDGAFGRYALFCGGTLLIAKPDALPTGLELDSMCQSISSVVSSKPVRFEKIETDPPVSPPARIEFADVVEVGRKYICNGTHVDRSAPTFQAFLDGITLNREVEVIKNSPVGRRLRDCVVQVGTREILASKWARSQAPIQRLVSAGYRVLDLPEEESAGNVMWFHQRDGEAILVSTHAESTLQTLRKEIRANTAIVPVDLSALGARSTLSDVVLKASISDS